MKKFKNILIIFIVLAIVIFLVGLIVVINNKDNIILNDNEFTFEYGEKVCSDVKCYLKDAGSTKDINNYKFDIGDLEIKDNELVSQNLEHLNVGEYNLTITYKKTSKNIMIRVVDTIPPEFINFNDLITLEQNSIDVDLLSFFKAQDLTEVRIEIDEDYDLSEVGEYTTKVIAVDENNNKTEKTTIIKVIDFDVAKKEGSVSKNLNGDVYKSQKMLDYENEKSKNIESNNNTPKTNTSNSNKTSNSNSNNSPNNNSNSTNKSSNSPRYRTDISNSIVSKINAYRISIGLSSLPVTSEAQAEADRRAKEIVTNQSHEGSSYGFGENIGGGGIGTDFYNLWMNSHAHYNAIIREQNVAIAASVYEVDGMWYAVVVFRMNY